MKKCLNCKKLREKCEELEKKVVCRKGHLLYCLTSLIEDCQAKHTEEINKILKFAKLEEDKKIVKRIIRANRLLEEELEDGDEFSIDAIRGYKEIIHDIETFRK